MERKLSVFTCKEFTGYYPVPVAAVVVASNERDAATLLNGALVRRGLPGDAHAEGMQLLCEAVVGDHMAGAVEVISDGDY